MESVQWAIGIGVIILIAVIGFLASQLWAHVVECRQMSARLESLSADVERAKVDIGTSETGMRGQLHRTATLCTEHELKIQLLQHERLK